MSILSKLFKKKKPSKMKEIEKKHFLMGWEVNLNGEKHCESFIKTQITTEETAKNAYAYIELIYNENNFLEEAIKRDEDGNVEIMNIEIDKIKYQNLSINRIFNFYENPNGLNYLGGKIPENFKIPENKCPGSFQYLGFLSKSCKAFKWLPYDINLISPIYMDMDKVWLDYTIPNEPSIINIEEINSLTTAYDDLKNDSFIEYKKKKFIAEKSDCIDYGIGVGGIPNWVQYSDIPRCPRSGKTMRFLCQLQSDSVLTNKTNVETKDDWYKQYFEKMDFWGGGDLYVFFEPETSIACYMIQNT